MHGLDAVVLLTYAIGLLWLGLRRSGRPDTGDELTLAGRSMPGWAVLCSMLATELSAATFIGVPQAAFVGDWSYLQLAIGALFAKLVLGRWLVPLYHRRGFTTVYELFRDAAGGGAERGVALAFVAGRTLASGARLFIAAQAVAVLAGLSSGGAIAVTGIVAGAYTVRGGIRAVIRTDVLQGAVFVVAIVALLAGLVSTLDLDLAALARWSLDAGRVTVLHPSPFLSLADHRALGTALVGGFALTLATHGTDQDMVQRLLTARDGRSGGTALRRSGWLNFPLTALFLSVGTVLAFADTHHGLPELAASERLVPTVARDLLPPGLRALVFAGLFAAAMSSLDSAICALSTTWVVDVAPRADDPRPERRLRRASVAFTGLLMAAAFAMAAYWRALQAGSPGHAPPLDLVQFALSAMSIVYGGLLGVFAVAWLRDETGTAGATLAGLAAGTLLGALLFLQPILLGQTWVAWPWWIPMSACVSAAIASRGALPEGAGR
jgi:SSS family transporter